MVELLTTAHGKKANEQEFSCLDNLIQIQQKQGEKLEALTKKVRELGKSNREQTDSVQRRIVKETVASEQRLQQSLYKIQTQTQPKESNNEGIPFYLLQILHKLRTAGLWAVPLLLDLLHLLGGVAIGQGSLHGKTLPVPRGITENHVPRHGAFTPHASPDPAHGAQGLPLQAERGHAPGLQVQHLPCPPAPPL